MNSEKPEVSQGPGTPLVRKRTLGGRLRGYLLAGVLVTAPLGVTVLLAWWIITFIDERITPLIPRNITRIYPLVFQVGACRFLALIGALTAGFLGRWV